MHTLETLAMIFKSTIFLPRFLLFKVSSHDPGTSASPGSLLEMKILGPDPLNLNQNSEMVCKYLSWRTCDQNHRGANPNAHYRSQKEHIRSGGNYSKLESSCLVYEVQLILNFTDSCHLGRQVYCYRILSDILKSGQV